MEETEMVGNRLNKAIKRRVDKNGGNDTYKRTSKKGIEELFLTFVDSTTRRVSLENHCRLVQIQTPHDVNHQIRQILQIRNHDS